MECLKGVFADTETSETPIEATLDDFRVESADGDRVSFTVEKGLMRGDYRGIRNLDIEGIEFPLGEPVPALSHYDRYNVLRLDAVKVNGRWRAFRDGAYPPWFPFYALERKLQEFLKEGGAK